jgi:hypothetical protein
VGWSYRAITLIAVSYKTQGEDYEEHLTQKTIQVIKDLQKSLGKNLYQYAEL